jgi:5'-AMP-activated protein kinase regulatory beta subunit
VVAWIVGAVRNPSLASAQTAQRGGRYVEEQQIQIQRTGKDIPFTCVAKDARSVFLVGSFNNWDPGATPMHRGGGDEWLAVVQLPFGRHEYKYVVDDIWCCKAAVEDGCYIGEDAVLNVYGTQNRVITAE